MVVQDGVEPFGLGAMCEVWADEPHPEDRTPVFDFRVVTPTPGRVRGPSGFDLLVDQGLDVAADADLVCLTPKRDFRQPYLVTGAGSAAGLDAALHLLRQEYGARVAAATARRIVVPPHRDGGQAQFIARPLPDCDSDALAPLLAWIGDHLGDDLAVETLAARVHMSPRTFARRFKEETGATPYSWVLGQRVRAAQELLEQTDQPVELIAHEVGLSGAAALRHHFARALGVSPQDYRRTFKTPA